MNNKVEAFKQVLLLLLLAMILGAVKVEYFISFIEEDLTDRTRLISYITLGISSVFYYFIIILAILASFYTLEFLSISLGGRFNLDNFYGAIKYFVWALMINEVVKLAITFLTFRSMGNIATEQEFTANISQNELWIQLISYSDIGFIILGGILFAIDLNEKDKNVKLYQGLIATLPLMASFIIFRLF